MLAAGQLDVAVLAGCLLRSATTCTRSRMTCGHSVYWCVCVCAMWQCVLNVHVCCVWSSLAGVHKAPEVR